MALLLEPVLETFKFGQVNLVLMALVAVDCLTERTRWPRGLLVGIAAAIKLTPAAFVLFFLLRGDRRAAVVTVVTAAAATGLGFAVDAASSARYWFGGPAAGVSGSVFYTNQTVQAVLARAEVPALAARAVWLVAAVALLALVAPVVRRAEPAPALVAVAGFALLISPTSWSHHWVWIAPALLVVVAEAVRRWSRAWAAAAVLLAVPFYVAPFRWLPHEQNQELAWNAAQQVVGATYVIVGILALVALRVAVLPPGARARLTGTERISLRGAGQGVGLGAQRVEHRLHRRALRGARAQHRLDDAGGAHPGHRAAGQAAAAAVVGRVAGQQGDAHAGRHELLGDGEVVDPLDDPRAGPGLHGDRAQHVVDRPADVHADPRLAGQLVEPQPAAPGERVPRRQHDVERLAQQRYDGEPRAPVPGRCARRGG